MARNNAGSDGKIEKAIWFLAGNIMALIGVGVGYLCYKWAMEPKFIEYRVIWIAGSATLSFILLRGAWFTIFPAKPEQTPLFSHDR